MQQRRFVITYDIRDDRRRTRVREWLKRFGQWTQLSVFVCDLSPTQMTTLRFGIEQMIDPAVDQVLLFNMGPTEGRARLGTTALGVPLHRSPSPKSFLL